MPSQFNLPTVQHALLQAQAPARPAAAAADNTHTPVARLAWRAHRPGMHLSSLSAVAPRNMHMRRLPGYSSGQPVVVLAV